MTTLIWQFDCFGCGRLCVDELMCVAAVNLKIVVGIVATLKGVSWFCCVAHVCGGWDWVMVVWKMWEMVMNDKWCGKNDVVLKNVWVGVLMQIMQHQWTCVYVIGMLWIGGKKSWIMTEYNNRCRFHGWLFDKHGYFTILTIIQTLMFNVFYESLIVFCSIIHRIPDSCSIRILSDIVDSNLSLNHVVINSDFNPSIKCNRCICNEQSCNHEQQPL